MEETILRFPHLGRQIFKKLNNKSLAKCKKIGRTWKSFIDNEKFAIFGMIKKISNASDKSIWKRLRIQTMEESKIFTIQLCKTYENLPKGNGSPAELYLSELYLASQLDLSELYLASQLNAAIRRAAFFGYLEVYQLIIENVKDENPRSKGGIGNGDTPLHLAAGKGHKRICQLILAKIEDKNPKDGNGITPLHKASEEGHLEICELIIKNVKEKNPKDQYGTTPLHRASEAGHLEICKLIIKNVEEINPENNFGQTPSQLAAVNCHSDVYQFIRKKARMKEGNNINNEYFLTTRGLRSLFSLSSSNKTSNWISNSLSSNH